MSSSHRHRHRAQLTPEQIAATRRRHIWWLGVLVLAVYASALGGGFVWSDREDILQGAHRLTDLDDVPAALSHSRDAYRQRDQGGQTASAAGTWQPLTLLSNSVSWALWGECALCFHLENLLLHGLVVVGLYALGRQILARYRHGDRVAVWAAAVYAVHPALVPTVAWIGGRAYLLAAVLGIWSLVVFGHLQAVSGSGPRHLRRWLLVLFLTASAAMLAHETAYLLPLVVLLIVAFDNWGRDDDFLAGLSRQQLAGLGLCLAVLLGNIGYRSLLPAGLSFAAGYPTDSAVVNAGMALRHLWYFIDQSLLPFEPTVSDAQPIIAGWGSAEVAALIGAVLIVAVTAVGLRLAHPSAFGVAWFLVWLVPGLGIFPSDRYHSSHTFYLAVWGLAFAVVYAAFTLWRPIGRQLVSGSEGLLFIPFIIFLGIVTSFSNARWWDQEGLFAGEIASDPHYIEGRLELAKAALENGDPEAAQNHTMAAFEASNDKRFTGYWSPRDGFFLLGRAQWELGLTDAAAQSFATALEVRPGDHEATYWLGVTQLAQQDYKGAEASLRKLTGVDNYSPLAKADLGAALAGQQRYAEALPLLSDAVDRGLGNATRHQALAMALIDAGDLQQAATQLQAALAYRETATERARLAWVHWRLGLADQARGDLNMALQLEETTSPYVDWVREQLQDPAQETGAGD